MCVYVCIYMYMCVHMKNQKYFKMLIILRQRRQVFLPFDIFQYLSNDRILISKKKLFKNLTNNKIYHLFSILFIYIK